MPCLPGEAGTSLWESGTDKDRLALAVATGEALARLHEAQGRFFGPYDAQLDDFIEMDDFPDWVLHRLEHWRASCRAVNALPTEAAYAAAKAGVLALTKSAAQEYARQGIRINALVAGAFRTPMLEGVFEHVAPGDTAAAEATYAQMVPMGRIGRPEEAADAVLWLCSDAATYVTGHSMIVDGGVTAPYR
jgi:NAD(P)-dependent dehydrogenase (short-subunit alcohol dehydrogenase family)